MAVWICHNVFSFSLLNVKFCYKLQFLNFLLFDLFFWERFHTGTLWQIIIWFPASQNVNKGFRFVHSFMTEVSCLIEISPINARTDIMKSYTFKLLFLLLCPNIFRRYINASQLSGKLQTSDFLGWNVDSFMLGIEFPQR